jgi:NitT/TauT family transport system substrate-binding protein
MELQDVTLVDVRPAEFTDAIAGGGIDAIVCYEPYTTVIRNRMGDSITEWPANNGQPSFGIVTARRDWIAHNPARAARFLASLDRASEYTYSHPEESRAIMEKRLNLSGTYMDTQWPKNQFGLSLDESLILAMEGEARWMIANSMTNATEVPDFRKYVYPDALQEIRPGSVNIIR